MLVSALALSTMLSTQPNYESLAKDWRNGALVYQVFVDRFVPSEDLDAKRSYYPSPDRLRTWSETPTATAYDPTIKTYPHVRDFWGGDLASLQTKLPYIKDLGAEVLYLQPIFKSPSNHKYDAEDYLAIDPQYGSEADFTTLLKNTHQHGLKLMLDGVFNHIGVTSPLFTNAAKTKSDPHRDWFFFDKAYPNGYLGWAGVSSLPRIKLENSEARNYLWKSRDSVVQRYLRAGIDGWRLDVAFELGHEYLADLTSSAHQARKGSAVIGEISGYPSDWYDAVDGTFNFTSVNVGVELMRGNLTGGQASQIFADMVQDAGLENILKSWLLAENHDTPRIASVVPDPEQRKLLMALQLTLPGSPCLYYGQELGMTGTGDPENRAPMRWDLANDKNSDFTWAKKLIQVRKRQPALRVGNYVPLRSNQLLAYARVTDKLRETVIVVMNPTNKTVQESFATRIGRIMSWGELEDQVTGTKIRSITGLMGVSMMPYSVMILTPVTSSTIGYSPYDRVK